MASNLTFTGNRTTSPHVFAIPTDFTIYAARSNNASGWQSLYDNKILDKALDHLADTPANLTDQQYTDWLNCMCLAVVGMSEDAVYSAGNNPFFDKLRDIAVYVANNIAVDTGSAYKNRNYIQLQAICGDFAWNEYMSEADRALVGTDILDRCDEMSLDADELMDGFSGIDQMCQLLGALVVYGRSGTGYDFTTGAYDAGTRLTEALEFWFGGNASTTTNGYGRIDAQRFYSSGGGGYSGWHYQSQRFWACFWVLNAIEHALTGVKLSGDDYDPWVDEEWVHQAWKYCVNICVRGDRDFFMQDDSTRISNPSFNFHERAALGTLIERSNTSTAQKAARWAWEQKDAWSIGLGQSSGNLYSVDFLLFDKADAQGDPGSLMDDEIWLDPPGMAWVRNNWNLAQSTIAMLRTPKWYFRGHHDLCRGSLQISHEGEMVLLDTGYYKPSPSNNVSDWGGSHNRGWKNQSISKSGVILVDDGSVGPHENTDVNSSYVAWESGLGGQYWKVFGAESDPLNTYNMQNDGSGLAWSCTEGTDTSKAGTVLSPAQDPEVFVVFSDLRRAYLLQSSDYGGGSERVRRMDCKWMFIKNFGSTGHLAVLFVGRVEARLSTMQKRQVWHFWDTVGDPFVSQEKNLIRFVGRGYPIHSDYNRYCAVDYYGYNVWNLNVVGGGTASDTTPGSHDFEYGGVNYAPYTPISPARHLADVGRVRVEVLPANAAAEHTFVCLIQPYSSGVGINTWEDYTWIEDDDYYGVEAGGKAYKLHKTQAQYIASGSPPDTTPPPPPTNLAGSTPASQTVQLTWDPSTATDISKSRVYEREKV